MVLGLLVAIPTASAADFYVDADGGDDAHSGMSEAQAWRSISRVNDAQVSLHPGDTIRFRRGQSFVGPLVLRADGAAGSPITYGAYGSGSNPTIAGAVAVTAWTDLGDGVWSTPVPGAAAAVNVVTVDGQTMAMGRWPNAGTANGGYRVFQSESHDAAPSITDDQLSAYPDWTGAEVVIRKMHWIIDRNRITQHTGGTLFYDHVTYFPRPGFGYFIQDDPRTLDAFGEWYFDRGGRNLRMWFGPQGPAGHAVHVGIVDILVDARSRHDVVLSGLELFGANEIAIDADAAQRVRITGCVVRSTGFEAVTGARSDGLMIDGCAIHHSGNSAIRVEYGGTNTVVRGNTIDDTAMLPGMGRSGDGNHIGIAVSGNRSVIEDNAVRRTGYNAIQFQGDDVLVQRNLVDGYNLLKDDGGGIYTYAGNSQDSYHGCRILDNVVINGPGAPDGTSRDMDAGCSGIYLDGNSSHLAVSGNTVAYNTYAGVFINCGIDIALNDNTLFDNRRQLMIVHADAAPLPPNTDHGLVITGNEFVSRTVDEPTLDVYSQRDDMAQLGWFSRNRYARPLDDHFTICRTIDGQATDGFDLARWRTRYGLDADSQTSAVTLDPYTLDHLGDNLFANSAFTSAIDGTECWSAAGNVALSHDASHLDGGCLQCSLQPTAIASDKALISFGIAAVGPPQRYLLRFSSLGTTEHAVHAFLRKADAPYTPLSSSRYFTIDATRQEHEFLITDVLNEPAPIVNLDFNGNEDPATFWIDNVGLFPADVTVTDAYQAIRLFINPTDVALTAAITGTMVDLSGYSHTGTIVIPGHRSVVLTQGSSAASPVVEPGAVAGRVGETLLIALSASNHPTSFSAAGLPDGLALDPASGMITGVPTTAGAYVVAITAVNAQGTGTGLLAVTIAAASSSPSGLPRSTSRGGEQHHRACGRGVGIAAVVLGMFLVARRTR